MKHFKTVKKRLPHIALPPIHKPRLGGWLLSALLLFVVIGGVSPQRYPVQPMLQVSLPPLPPAPPSGASWTTSPTTASNAESGEPKSTVY